MPEELAKPAQVAKRLDLAPSTLRVYSSKFAEVLSESASNPPLSADGKAGHRLYTPRDITILAKAKDLLSKGMTYDQVLGELRSIYGASRRSRLTAERGEAEAVALPGYSTIAHLERILSATGAALANTQKLAEIWQQEALERKRELAELQERVEAFIERYESEIGEIKDRLKHLEEQPSSFFLRLFGR
ncbi:MAG: helix-turn-helix domain-containing protein [Chloroflexi bacterium]|nr:helix-turn-helix domain-containing protein [Chloroflexota bacterium]MCL5075054.1 helix-turn-helix domain-containing protein [Chloroflexota bacterium]